MCILGRIVGRFHVTFESLPGIVTSYEDNLLKTKVCNNLRLIASNLVKNIQEIDYGEQPQLINKGVQVKTPL